MTSARSRLAHGARTALAVILTLPPATLLHELVSFGLIRPMIRGFGAGCTAGGGCVGIVEVVSIHLILAAMLAIVFGLAGALLGPLRHGDRLLGVFWLLTYGWALATIASGYRAAFGTTWLWFEPFLELMFHPVLTPLLAVLGLVAFLYVLRPRVRPLP